MTLNLSMPGNEELKPRITVFGVGGAGGNAVDNMIEKLLDGVDFVVANTDAQALSNSQSQSRIQLGVKVTEGLGAGARPTVGAAAAEESIEQIVDHLAGAHMCFITAGMGGGTGTGAAPIIAQAARELGVLTVGVVTKPFQFEGAKRMKQAEAGIEALQKVVDTLIIIPNQNLFRLANERTTFTEAFSMADDVLYQGVKGVTDLMVRPGLINLDFADVRAVMDEMGKAMMGTGEAEGEERAVQAAEKAIANPLLDEISLRGAKGVLINITGGSDLTLFELDEAANRIRDEVDPDANIIVGSTLDDSMQGMMRVSVVATGIDASEDVGETPVPRRRMAQPLPGATVEEQPAPAAAAEPAPAYKPAARFEDEEPSLFEGFEPEAASAQPDFDSFGEETHAGHASDEDALPEPVYQPRRQSAPAPAMEPEPENFVAPRAAAPGTPSPETMARLREATQRGRPEASPRPDAARPQPVRRIGAHQTEQPEPAERGSRFSVNSLIGRMTGHGNGQGHAQHGHAQQHGHGHGDVPPQPARRSQPPVQAQRPAAAPAPAPRQEHDPEQEKIDIPAFLRRQAN
ncbi:cell division protein FtsZ [Citreimonas salinaria]|uniref:Cell division protein FtsZ n=1 Tax=Citreimonas salinaria TaxID=321339 RepID=A0A1H3G242_9RHOB|nr:cell division protein FtsZ [Citreimonas salinaria]SDX96429.1 cell division protein FtsZ [Citreimonas salinaria]